MKKLKPKVNIAPKNADPKAAEIANLVYAIFGRFTKDINKKKK